MVEVYNIPLRKAKRVPKSNRASKALKIVKEQLRRNTGEEVRVDNSINQKIWEKGAVKIPSKVRVKVEEEEEGYTAYLEE